LRTLLELDTPLAPLSLPTTALVAREHAHSYARHVAGQNIVATNPIASLMLESQTAL